MNEETFKSLRNFARQGATPSEITQRFGLHPSLSANVHRYYVKKITPEHGSRWSHAEETFFKKNYKKLKDSQLTQILGKTLWEVARRRQTAEWEPYELEFVAEMIKDLATKLERTREEIVSMVRHLSKRRSDEEGPGRPRRWTEEEDEVIRNSAGKIPTNQLAVKLGRTERAVYNRGYKLGLTLLVKKPR